MLVLAGIHAQIGKIKEEHLTDTVAVLVAALQRLVYLVL